MIISHDNCNYAINFFYQDDQNNVGRKSLERPNNKKITTTCSISTISQENNKKTFVDLCKEHCVKHPNDPFDKSYGRRIALARALVSFGRSFRKEAWNNYFKNHNDLK